MTRPGAQLAVSAITPRCDIPTASFRPTMGVASWYVLAAACLGVALLAAAHVADSYGVDDAIASGTGGAP